ncbi:MAG: hypothetical protein J6S67_20290 [Methanobrevibacter sp.]|nr:hypothetical protein [Clostridia bacterium]MBO7734912.1 hypothetical protein [Methanobrevibacter sp.]
MTKDEMKCRISMALKSPRLQLGFENICKNLSDLEKENAEIQYKLKNLVSVAEVRLANWQKYKKENTELKEEIADINKNFTLCESNADTYYDLLIKAKELIEDMYDKIPASHSDYYKDVMDRAKAFFKEVSE